MNTVYDELTEANLRVMSTDDLRAWTDACTVLFMFEMNDKVEGYANALSLLPRVPRTELRNRIGDEEDRRMEHHMAVSAAHELEQHEARIADRDENWKERAKHRAARLINLINLNAPEPILNDALKLLASMARE